jgi:outer membrane lipoprotein carrier protein
VDSWLSFREQKIFMRLKGRLRVHRSGEPGAPQIGSLVVVLGVLVAMHGAVAEEKALGSARLERFLADLTTFSAHFEQGLYDEYGDLVETVEGDVEISRPGRFRWEYKHPYRQLIVTDGTTLWVYDAELEQVSVNPLADNTAGSPAELLVGDIDLDRYYEIVEAAPEEGIAWVALTPRAGANQYRTIEIGLDEDGIRGMRLRDNLNQLTVLSFSAIRRNIEIADERFNFVPPPGVDVVSGRVD